MIRLSRWRVDLAWTVVLVLPFADPTLRSILAALPLVAAGVALRAWARGHLERARRVTQTGPYAYLRHPLYVGSFCIALGFAVSMRLPLLLPFVTIVFLAMYVPKALREEAWLRRRFGDDYDAYARRVGAVLPRRPTWLEFRWPRVVEHREWKTWAGVAVLPRWPACSEFRWRRVVEHREWKTWAGVAVLLALLWLRAAVHAPH